MPSAPGGWRRAHLQECKQATCAVRVRWVHRAPSSYGCIAQLLVPQCLSARTALCHATLTDGAPQSHRIFKGLGGALQQGQDSSPLRFRHRRAGSLLTCMRRSRCGPQVQQRRDGSGTLPGPALESPCVQRHQLAWRSPCPTPAAGTSGIFRLRVQQREAASLVHLRVHVDCKGADGAPKVSR